MEADHNSAGEYGHSSFRDALTTVDDDGKRLWVYAKKPSGKWYTRRSWFGYGLLAFLLAAPFLKLNGHQLLLFDVVHRKFVLFGSVFWPHDFFLFLVGFIAFIVFIFLFTAIYGRLWCGWACPQTIFMEMVFRRIEYIIEGDASAQKKLDKMEWNNEKLLKRGGKYLAFYMVSFIISNIFLAYIIGSSELIKIATESPTQHIGGLSAILVFSGVFYFVYAYMREQVCTVVCPYGRLQSVLIDDDTLTVAYNYKRGEPREKWGRKRSDDAGDCINCAQCVDVCPTGIDIRNGIQLECVNCTACIDACNSVMKKIGKEPDLITLASKNGIEKNEKFHMNTRRKVYSAMLCLLVVGLGLLLYMRSDIQATILRTPGMEYSELPGGNIKNIYNIKVLNKTFEKIPVEIRMESAEGKITNIGEPLVAPGEDYAEGILAIEINKKYLPHSNNSIVLGVYSHGKKLQTVKTNFMAPGNEQL
jgi:cytochrome c oxidase accessory protein FixG